MQLKSECSFSRWQNCIRLRHRSETIFHDTRLDCLIQRMNRAAANPSKLDMIVLQRYCKREVHGLKIRTSVDRPTVNTIELPASEPPVTLRSNSEFIPLVQFEGTDEAPKGYSSWLQVLPDRPCLAAHSVLSAIACTGSATYAAMQQVKPTTNGWQGLQPNFTGPGLDDWRSGKSRALDAPG